MSNIKIAIVYFSKYGHTRLQAEAVRDGAASFKGSAVLLLDAAEGSRRNLYEYAEASQASQDDSGAAAGFPLQRLYRL